VLSIRFLLNIYLIGTDFFPILILVGNNQQDKSKEKTINIFFHGYSIPD